MTWLATRDKKVFPRKAQIQQPSRESIVSLARGAGPPYCDKYQCHFLLKEAQGGGMCTCACVRVHVCVTLLGPTYFVLSFYTSKIFQKGTSLQCVLGCFLSPFPCTNTGLFLWVKQKSSQKAEPPRPRNPGQASAPCLVSAGKATTHLLSVSCELDTLPLHLPWAFLLLVSFIGLHTETQRGYGKRRSPLLSVSSHRLWPDSGNGFPGDVSMPKSFHQQLQGSFQATHMIRWHTRTLYPTLTAWSSDALCTKTDVLWSPICPSSLFSLLLSCSPFILWALNQLGCTVLLPGTGPSQAPMSTWGATAGPASGCHLGLSSCLLTLKPTAHPSLPPTSLDLLPGTVPCP